MPHCAQPQLFGVGACGPFLLRIGTQLFKNLSIEPFEVIRDQRLGCGDRDLAAVPQVYDTATQSAVAPAAIALDPAHDRDLECGDQIHVTRQDAKGSACILRGHGDHIIGTYDKSIRRGDQEFSRKRPSLRRGSRLLLALSGLVEHADHIEGALLPIVALAVEDRAAPFDRSR